MNSNFDRLTGKWQFLGKLGQESGQYVSSDPSVALFKLRLFGEKMTDEILRFEGINPLEMDNQVDKLGKLEEEQRLPEEILKMFHNIRKAGNRAAHAGEGTSEEASILLQQASRLSSWFVGRYVENNHEFDKFIQQAEQYVTSDPSVALFKLRVFAEKMTDEILRLEGINPLEMDNQVDKLSILEEKQRLPEEILKMFHNIRKAGNRAAHTGEGATEEASILLKQASHLSSWFAERYVEKKGGNNQKPLDNTQQYTSVGKNKLSSFFVRFRPLPVFILFVGHIGERAGVETAFYVGIFFLLYMLFRGNLQKNEYRTTGWTIMALFCAFFIGVFLIKGSYIAVNIDHSNYDATIYINDEANPIDTPASYHYFHSIEDGSKVYAEWSFPWGKMKSDTEQVENSSAFSTLLGEPQRKFLRPKADSQLKKQLTNFFNGFAKQCLQSTRDDDPNLAPFVSGAVRSCLDVSDNDHEKLIETGIAFDYSWPMSDVYNHPVIFYLSAYYKYEVNGKTEIHYGSFVLVYDKTKKSWSIESESDDTDPYYFEVDDPENVITKF